MASGSPLERELHDQRALRAVLLDGTSGTVLFDAANGQRLASFPRDAGVTAAVRPDLQAKLIASSTDWELVPLPQPVSAPPAEGLKHTLGKMGLALDGVEIVAAP